MCPPLVSKTYLLECFNNKKGKKKKKKEPAGSSRLFWHLIPHSSILIAPEQRASLRQPFFLLLLLFNLLIEKGRICVGRSPEGNTMTTVANFIASARITAGRPAVIIIAPADSCEWRLGPAHFPSLGGFRPDCGGPIHTEDHVRIRGRPPPAAAVDRYAVLRDHVSHNKPAGAKRIADAFWICFVSRAEVGRTADGNADAAIIRVKVDQRPSFERKKKEKKRWWTRLISTDDSAGAVNHGAQFLWENRSLPLLLFLLLLLFDYRELVNNALARIWHDGRGFLAGKRMRRRK